MTVNSGAPSPIDWTSLSPDQVDKLRQAYLGTYRGAHRENPNGDSATGTLPPGIDGELAACCARSSNWPAGVCRVKRRSRCTTAITRVASARPCRSSPTPVKR